jgi:hypothetical protein
MREVLPTPDRDDILFLLVLISAALFQFVGAL